MSRQVLTPTAQPGMFEALKRFFSPANRYLSPLLISCVLLVGQLSYGILESYTRTLLAIGASLVGRADSVAHLLWQVAKPGQRLHYRHQRGHPGAISRLLALCPLRADFDYLEVRASRPRPAHLEPIQLWDRCHVYSRFRHGGRIEHPVGELYLAHDRDLDVGFGDHLAPAPFPHQCDLCRVVFAIRFASQLDHG